MYVSAQNHFSYYTDKHEPDHIVMYIIMYGFLHVFEVRALGMCICTYVRVLYVYAL